MLTSLYSLFYVTGECHRFYTEDEPFDIVHVSHFTAIPVNKACDCIRNKLNNDNTLHLRTSLNTDDSISHWSLFF